MNMVGLTAKLNKRTFPLDQELIEDATHILQQLRRQRFLSELSDQHQMVNKAECAVAASF